MARDWWWPWWISSLFDVGVVVLAVIVFVRANRRLVRQVAVVVGIGAIVAAGLAPVVMKGKASDTRCACRPETRCDDDDALADSKPEGLDCSSLTFQGK